MLNLKMYRIASCSGGALKCDHILHLSTIELNCFLHEKLICKLQHGNAKSRRGPTQYGLLGRSEFKQVVCSSRHIPAAIFYLEYEYLVIQAFVLVLPSSLLTRQPFLGLPKPFDI